MIGFKSDPLMSEKCEGMVFKRHRMEKVVLSVLINQVAMNMLLFSNCNWTCFIILHFMTKFSCSLAFLSQKLFVHMPRLAF